MGGKRTPRSHKLERSTGLAFAFLQCEVEGLCRSRRDVSNLAGNSLSIDQLDRNSPTAFAIDFGFADKFVAVFLKAGHSSAQMNIGPSDLPIPVLDYEMIVRRVARAQQQRSRK